MLRDGQIYRECLVAVAAVIFVRGHQAPSFRLHKQPFPLYSSSFSFPGLMDPPVERSAVSGFDAQAK